MLRLLLALTLLAGCGGTTDAPATSGGDGVAMAAPAQSDSAEPAKKAPAGKRSNIDVAGLKAALDGSSVRLLVDVRTPGEFGGGHVPGAVNIPLNELPGRMAELGKAGDEVHLICKVGGRSSRAADLAMAQGFSAVNVEGGTMAWMAAGHPTE